MIHKSSVIDTNAKISSTVTIGPFCYIGPNVELSDGVELISNVHIEGFTKIGKNTKIYPFAAIGTQPQDLKFKKIKPRFPQRIIDYNGSCFSAIKKLAVMSPNSSKVNKRSPPSKSTSKSKFKMCLFSEAVPCLVKVISVCTSNRFVSSLLRIFKVLVTSVLKPSKAVSSGLNLKF